MISIQGSIGALFVADAIVDRADMVVAHPDSPQQKVLSIKELEDHHAYIKRGNYIVFFRKSALLFMFAIRKQCNRIEYVVRA